MTKPYMQYEPEEFEGTGFVARWRGGEYVEIGRVDAAGLFHAGDVVSVWDYEAGRPRTEFLSDPFEALRETVDGWLAEYEAEKD